jgi:AraC-like DNA-binding protein
MNRLLQITFFLHSTKLYLLPIGIIILLFFHSLRNQNLAIYPGLGSDKISGFDDHETDGNSRVVLHNDSSLSRTTLNYVLGEKIQYPYSGIKFILKKGKYYKNLSGYDFFSVELSTNSGQEINLFLHTIIPGFTDESKVLSYRYLLKTIKPTLPNQTFMIPLTSFTVPTWWYVLNKFPDDSLQKENFRQVAEIIIENGYDNQKNVPYSISVFKVTFRKSIMKRGVYAFCCILFWITLCSLIYLICRNYKLKKTQEQVGNKKIVISYEPLEIGNDSDDNLTRIVAFIAKEYKNQELSLNQVADGVGVSPSKITQILREKKSCSYKQYLNSIRLSEAKRLLLETDRNIVDIAQKVGYSNVTHFNRIFKTTEGISPRQFRTSKADVQNTASQS